MQRSLNKSKDDPLPKIHSQKRIHTTSDRRQYTQEDNGNNKVLANRPLSNNGRTRSLRAFSSKTVRYEATGNAYNKKIQEIQKQDILIDNEMKIIQQQIDRLRKSIRQTKKQPTMSRLNQSSASFMSKISSRKISVSDGDNVKLQLKALETRILNNRNKIDVHIQKNKAIQKQIDAYRKQISTLKKINQQLQSSYSNTTIKCDEQSQFSRRLDQQIGAKNDLIHRKRVQNMHKKAHMIKQYDAILKTLDRQLGEQKKNGNEQDDHDRENFYLTDLIQNRQQVQQSRVVRDSIQNRSSKKLKINEIRQKLYNYEKQFEQLKQKIGSENIQEITRKFTEQYQQNFHQYNFINELYQEYEERNFEQLELIRKKNEIMKEIEAQKSDGKIKEIIEHRERIRVINKKKTKIEQDMHDYDELSFQLSSIVRDYLSTLPQHERPTEQLNERTLATYLDRLLQDYQHDLDNDFTDTLTGRNISVTKENVDSLLDQVRRDAQIVRQQRLLSRDQLQKNSMNLKQKKLELSTINKLVKNKKDIRTKSQSIGGANTKK